MKKGTRKLLAVILVLVVLLSGIPMQSLAAGESEFLAFSKTEYTANVNSYVTVVLKSKANMTLTVLDLSIPYNKEYLSAEEATAGAALAPETGAMGGVTIAKTGENEANPIIAIGYTTTTKINIRAGQELAKIKFKVLKAGSKDLNVAVEDLYDSKPSGELIKDYSAGTIKTTVTGTIGISGITLSEATGSLNKGETKNLTATVTPPEATYEKVQWTSDNEKVAKVESTAKNTATVTAIGGGTATITASAGEKKATYKVTVNVPLTGIKMADTLKVPLGKTRVLKVEKDPIDATEDLGIITWTSSDDTIATVEDGVIAGVSEGTVTITATMDRFTKTCEVTVKEFPLVGIELNTPDFELGVNETKKISVIYKSEDPEVEPTTGVVAPTWTSSDDTIATVEDGIVKGIKAGTVTITAKVGEFEKNVKVTITEKMAEKVTEKDNIGSPQTGIVSIGMISILLIASVYGITFILKRSKE